MRIFTKDQLIKELIDITKMGWIPNARPGNSGGIGNTIEDLLGIVENNLPLPNAAEWELKCQRIGRRSSLTTLLHSEPSPRALRFVPQILLPFYGWAHQTIENELSFRQTIHGNSRSDRGFKVVINRAEQKVLISFDQTAVSERHSSWLRSVNKRVGLHELDPQPYWGFDDLHHIVGTKLINCFYLKAEVKRADNIEYFKYTNITILEKFHFENFLNAIENGTILIDFDARTGHNHGTKFRMKNDKLQDLYEKVKSIL
jgi:hypothetical protein